MELIKKPYRISALLDVKNEPHLTLQNSETLAMEYTLDSELITEEAKEEIRNNPNLPQCILDYESIFEDLAGKKIPNPRKVVEFCLKHDLYIYPAVYNDLCTSYCEEAYGYSCFFSSDSINGMLDAVEENLDKFPQAGDFPTTDQLLTAFEENIHA